MSRATIAQTRNSFSSIVHQLTCGELTERYVMNGDRPVVKMVPIEQQRHVSARIGAMRGVWDGFDYEQFRALDSEITQTMRI